MFILLEVNDCCLTSRIQTNRNFSQCRILQTLSLIKIIFFVNGEIKSYSNLYTFLSSDYYKIKRSNYIKSNLKY